MGPGRLTAEEIVAEYAAGRRDFDHLWLEDISLTNCHLDGAQFVACRLRGADFSEAHLRQVSFEEADLTGASLHRSDLFNSYLEHATLTDTNLRQAFVLRASFRRATCLRTVLSEAMLGLVTFEETEFNDIQLDDAYLGGTVFSDVDMGCFCEASLRHYGPSTIDARSVMKSYRNHRLKPFMVDCGVPEIFAEYMIECARALGDDVLHELMQSTFISYGGPDEDFARGLYEALRANGVVTFFFPETARIGERIGDEVFNALQRHDRMILVCSRASLDRPGVLNEVQETLDREARDGGATYLIPVMLDDYLLSEWAERQPVLAERVKRRVAADFRDPDRFDASLARLLAALKKKGPRQ